MSISRVKPLDTLPAGLLPEGMSAGQLLALEELEETSSMVYVSGSLVEGLGNPMSDVDVYVLGDATPSGQVVIRKAAFQISVQFAGQRRVDFEYWSIAAVDRIISRLDEISIGSDFVAEKLEPIEELLIHRLLLGVPLNHQGRFLAARTLSARPAPPRTSRPPTARVIAPGVSFW
jgi:predicted nucleotidyltransferase